MVLTLSLPDLVQGRFGNLLWTIGIGVIPVSAGRSILRYRLYDIDRIISRTVTYAALFQPLRRRVQNIVDRRFNRSRYDAQHTAADFGRRLRDQVDVDAVRTQLLTVVQETMQPSSAGLWLRAPQQSQQ